MLIRVALSTVLGLFTFITLSIADAYLTIPGHRETPVASWLIAALYLALAQFLLAPKNKGFGATRPTLIAMLLPVALFFFVALANETHANVAGQTGWWLLIGCGGVIGAAAASVCGKRALRREEPHPN